jgi:hypothetical protein
MHIVCINNHGNGYLQVLDSYSIKDNGVFKAENVLYEISVRWHVTTMESQII